MVVRKRSVVHGRAFIPWRGSPRGDAQSKEHRIGDSGDPAVYSDRKEIMAALFFRPIFSKD